MTTRRAPTLPFVLLSSLPVTRALLGGALIGLVAGCTTPSPPLAIEVAAAYGADRTCGAPLKIRDLKTDNPTVRLSVRSKDDKGAVLDVCDAAIDLTKPTTWGFPKLVNATPVSKVDLFVEVFGGADGTQRIASGRLLDVNATDPSGRKLTVYETEQYRCTSETRLNKPRAFHTATKLKSGHVLYIGGLTTNSEGNDLPATGKDRPVLFATSTIEVYDPLTRAITLIAEAGDAKALPARAFHRAAVVTEDAEGNATILVVGGAQPVDASKPLVATTDGRLTDMLVLPNNFRLRLEGNSDPAPAQLITFDAKTKTVTRTTVAGLADVSLILQGAAQLEEGGVALAGGMKYGEPTLAQPLLGVVRDGMSSQKGMLVSPRSGAALVGFRDGSGKTTSALMVGGVSKGGDMFSTFERIDIAGLKSSAVSGTVAIPPLYLPTVTLMDDPPGATPRFLISGGLEVQNNGLAVNPPGDPTFTMYQVAWSPSAPMLQTTAVVAKGFGAGRCSPGTDHYKVAAFDAATLLPSRDRILVTGGTPRKDLAEPCSECEAGDDNFVCPLGQAAIVTVPASAMDAPQMTPARRLTYPRFGHTQTLLNDGTVLIAGGLTRRGADSYVVAQTEIFNPARTVAPAAHTNAGNAAEPDDPLHDEILKLPEGSQAVREPSKLMHAPDQPGSRRHSCVEPTK